MDRRQLLLQTGAGAVALAGLGPIGRALAQQTFPSGPISVLLPLQAGSASDVAVRTVSDQLGRKLDTPFVVENVTGAGGLVGLDRIARVKPDGQTLAALNNSIMTILPHLQRSKMRMDPRSDLVPIAGLANIPTFLGVRQGSPFKTVAELVEYSKQHTGELTYSSGGVGSPQHMAAEMLSAYSGAKLLHVPYKGASQAALALAAGEVDVMTIALSLALPYLPEGRVELIGYCGPKRHPQYPNQPTLAEQGVKNYDYSSWIALFAPKGTPAAALELLQKNAVAVAAYPAMHEQLIRAGLEPWERDPAQLAATIAKDYARWGEVVRISKIPTV